MGNTIRTFHFTVIVARPEKWDKDHLEEYKKLDDNPEYGGSYDDFVCDQLDAIMRKAGNLFIKENDDLFITSELT